MRTVLNFLALVLVVAGALNWGLWGFFQFDMVAWLCKGNTTWMARLIYAIVGLGGVWSLRFFCKCKHICCEPCCDTEKKDKGSSGGCCKM